MLLDNKVAVIYGAGGAVGSAVAKAFACEGARLFLAGRNLASVQPIAAGVDGAEAAEVDVLDEAAIERHMDQVIARAGQVDISFNAAGIPARRVEQQGHARAGAGRIASGELRRATGLLSASRLPDSASRGAAHAE